VIWSFGRCAPHFEQVAVGATRRIGGEPRPIGHQHPHILCEAGVHRIAQFHEIGEYDLAGRQQQTDMPGGADRVALLVVADRVGQHDLSALRDFDVSSGDDQGQLVVVLDFVGLKDNRSVLVDLLAPDAHLGAGRRRRRRHHQHRADHGEKRGRQAPGAESGSGGTLHSLGRSARIGQRAGMCKQICNRRCDRHRHNYPSSR